MQITDDHVEWAIVSRLQKMLEASPHPEFNVTHTYALFVSILCWTAQRIRTRHTTEADRLAAGVLTKLKEQRVEDSPWNIRTSNYEVVPIATVSTIGLGPFAEFRNMTVDRFFINLRNAVAHGDARNVRPFHRQVTTSPGRELVGFSFDCEERDRDRVVVWSGTMTLLEADMRRIGRSLADTFCKTLRHVEHGSDSSFGRDAAQGVIERAA